MSAATTIDTTAETKPDALAVATSELEPAEALVLRSDIADFLGRVTVLRERAKGIRVTGPGQESEEKAARVTRLALRTERVEGIKRCKELKASSLRRGRALDGVANVIREMIEPVEEYLLSQETYSQRAEEARKSALGSARGDALRAYEADPSLYVALGELTDEAWATILDSARLAHEGRIDAKRQEEAIRIEAEKIAAAKREEARVAAVQAEAARVERERQQKEENDRLRAEAAEREATAARELAAVKAEAEAEAARVAAVHEAQRAASEREARRKHEEDIAARKVAREAEEARQVELTKAKEEADRVARELAAEREASARVTAERESAEAARVADEEAARQATLLAPDREKLAAFAIALPALVVPTLTTTRGKAAATKVTSQLAKMVAWISSTAESM